MDQFKKKPIKSAGPPAVGDAFVVFRRGADRVEVYVPAPNTEAAGEIHTLQALMVGMMFSDNPGAKELRDEAMMLVIKNKDLDMEIRALVQDCDQPDEGLFSFTSMGGGSDDPTAA